MIINCFKFFKNYVNMYKSMSLLLTISFSLFTITLQLCSNDFRNKLVMSSFGECDLTF